MISLKRLFEQKNQIQIYCDMDGVLTDFNGSILKLGYKGPLPARSPEDKKMLWAFVKDNAEKFWGDMPWLPDGKTIWKTIEPYEPILLTSVASNMNSKLGIEGKKGKERWIKRELGEKYLKTALIVASGDKTKYASSNSILIDDDDLKNVNPWIKAGGIGITHRTVAATLGRLQKIMK
jgi:hypothetical protein